MSGHLGVHFRDCGWERRTILRKQKDKLRRQIIEARAIGQAGSECVQSSSLSLSNK